MELYRPIPPRFSFTLQKGSRGNKLDNIGRNRKISIYVDWGPVQQPQPGLQTVQTSHWQK